MSTTVSLETATGLLRSAAAKYKERLEIARQALSDSEHAREDLDLCQTAFDQAVEVERGPCVIGRSKWAQQAKGNY